MKYEKNLHMSEKSSTFAIGIRRVCIPSPEGVRGELNIYTK